jgi:hypothetical protein
VRGAYYPYSFGGIFGYPYYGAGYGYGDYGEEALVVMERAMATTI